MVDVAQYINEVKRDSDTLQIMNDVQVLNTNWIQLKWLLDNFSKHKLTHYCKEKNDEILIFQKSITNWIVAGMSQLKNYGHLIADGELKIKSNNIQKSRYLILYWKLNFILNLCCKIIILFCYHMSHLIMFVCLSFCVAFMMFVCLYVAIWLIFVDMFSFLIKLCWCANQLEWVMYLFVVVKKFYFILKLLLNVELSFMILLKWTLYLIETHCTNYIIVFFI